MKTPSCWTCGYHRVFDYDDGSKAKRWKAGDLVCIFTVKWERIGETHTGVCKAHTPCAIYLAPRHVKV